MKLEKINKIKQEINQIIKQENLAYCEICYDGECEDDDNVWLYDLIVYDEEPKIIKITSELNKYGKATLSKNMDDGDYTIECYINIGDDKMTEPNWWDELDSEEDLMCLDWHEYHDKEPYFVDKQEIEHIFENEKEIEGTLDNIQIKEISKYRYELIRSDRQPLYFVCPQNARKQVKEDWEKLKPMFKKYIR